ncbi:homeobox-domain-containing protein [Fistulina hepatica ATCC 64428]|uniref:Homeobox-domain-containing protein n=1 Tax=Fistulina hepatica ATCC 64428 TaxID=1128425 RepID=A0A0D7AET4_9AGAR|nr:homeobox-domain-containing protein [Fistulina hepatica ATCC 64428]
MSNSRPPTPSRQLTPPTSRPSGSAHELPTTSEHTHPSQSIRLPPLSVVAPAAPDPGPSSRSAYSYSDPLSAPPTQSSASYTYSRPPIPELLYSDDPYSRRPLQSPPSAVESSLRTRRLRRGSPPGPRGRTPSSESQGELADTEQEVPQAGPSQPSPQQEQQPQQPAKKKRTRTLTTPHQSAVLHALLAQSRFPTTAMREEVGRTIGLSARKVQIWFQNQRQKARRPRTGAQAEVPRQQGRPQSRRDDRGYAGLSDPGTSSAGLSTEALTLHGHRYDPPRYSGYPPPDPYSSSSRLVGPGMSGLSLPRVEVQAPYPPLPSSPRPPTFRHRARPRPYPETSVPPPLRPVEAPGRQHRGPPPDLSRTLPPLVLRDEPQFYYDPLRSPMSPYGHSVFPGPESSSTLPPAPPIDYAEQARRASLTLPPLVPSRTRWDTPTFRLPRPDPLASSQSSSARDRPIPPLLTTHSYSGDEYGLSGEGETGAPPPSPSSPPRRSGRYDPVRGTFVPYSPTHPSDPRHENR